MYNLIHKHETDSMLRNKDKTMTETCSRKDRHLVKLSISSTTRVNGVVRDHTDCHLSLLNVSRQPGEKLEKFRDT